MGPAAVELELSLLSSSPADTITDVTADVTDVTADVTADSSVDVDLIISFIEFLTYLFSTKRDVDLATSYLGLLLKVSSLCVCLFLCLSVCLCLSVTIVSPAKAAEPVKMLFVLWTRVGPRNHVLDGGPDPPCKGAIVRGKGRPIVKQRDLLP